MKRSKLLEIQGVLVEANHSKLAKELVVGRRKKKKGPSIESYLEEMGDFLKEIETSAKNINKSIRMKKGKDITRPEIERAYDKVASILNSLDNLTKEVKNL